jgi:sulfite reductase alpha subunit-like flavoprotein
VCVISTTGNGEEPDMSRKFFRELRKKGRSFLSSVRVSVCGLGSTDYSQFCEGGIKLRRLLVDKEKGAGADEILPLAKVDDVNFEEHVEAWKDALHAKLKEMHAHTTDNDQATAQPQQAAHSAAPAAPVAALPAAVPAAAVGSAAAAAAAPVPVVVSSSSASSLSSAAPGVAAVSASPVAAAASASALSSQSASRARSGWAPPTPSSSASLDFASFVAEHSSSPSALSPALILYATVTGNAESIAQQVAERWRAAWPNEPLRVLSTEQLMQQPDNVNAQRHTAAAAAQRWTALQGCGAPPGPISRSGSAVAAALPAARASVACGCAATVRSAGSDSTVHSAPAALTVHFVSALCVRLRLTFFSPVSCLCSRVCARLCA